MNQPTTDPPRITYRPIIADPDAEPNDLELLYRIYASTRHDELAPVPWSAAQKEAFLRSQFHAQHTHYLRHFPDAELLIVLVGGREAGRLYLDRRDDEHRLIDIALLPEYRNRGLGAAMMQGVLEEAAEAGKIVRIHVERNNPAMRLYRRLGFEKIEDQGVYDLMEWIPPAR